MIQTDSERVSIDGAHLRALYVFLRRNEESLEARMSEIRAAVERVLYESMSIDELERLNDENAENA